MQLFILVLSLLPWIPAYLCGVTTGEELTVLEGQSLTIPCLYEPQYASYVKYWCQGSMREFCTSLARTDDPRPANPAEDKVSISDDRVQQVFTVTMNNLKEGDTGWYMCGVEIGSAWKADVVAFTNIKVIHGMSVVNSQVSGEEGSNVTVDCLYSERYRESEKKWCRRGDWSSCLSTGPEGSYVDTSVAISDDRTRTFTITLKKLRLSDSGWYMCSAGQQQIPVHVQVTPRPTTTAVSVTSPPTPSQSVAYLPQNKTTACWSFTSHSYIFVSLVVGATLLALVGIYKFGTRLWKLQNKNPVLKSKASINKYSGDEADLQNAVVLYKDYHDIHMY